MAMDGKVIQLRASCNACNESKVRCSQRKPTCARCERNGAECIYGLSRRTHKDAPPISMPSSSSQRPRGYSRPCSNRDTRLNGNGNSNGNGNGSGSGSSSSNSSSNNGNGNTSSNSNTNTTSTSTGTSTPSTSSSDAGTHDAALFGDYMAPHFMMAPQQQQQHQNLHQNLQQQQQHQQQQNNTGLPLLDFGSLEGVTGTGTTSSSSSSGRLNDPLSRVVTPFATPGAEYANPWALDKPMLWARQTLGGPTTGIPSSWASECSCHVGVMELLASMRGSSDDQRMSLDAHLAKLKRCIVSCETSMACPHDRDDSEPINIMAVATLIGYVIAEFEMAAFGAVDKGASLSSGSDEPMTAMVDRSTNATPGTHFEPPRLSWGVLELEDDEEVDLRQMLYLLSFRKLERLLSQLTLYLRNLHDARGHLPDPSRHMAFVMACDYTRLWLEKRAEDAKKLFSTVDPALSHHMEL